MIKFYGQKRSHNILSLTKNLANWKMEPLISKVLIGQFLDSW